LSFLGGAAISSALGAAEDQGLAGPAIVLGYGLMSAMVGLFIGMLTSLKTNGRQLVKINWFLFVALMAFISILILFRWNKNNSKGTGYNQNGYTQHTTTFASLAELRENYEGGIDLGFFAPNLYESPTLFLYNDPNFDKTILEHYPTDTITFNKTEYGHYSISSAPPYLVPEHMKMDYDLLLFKLKSMGEEFAEIEVNKMNGLTRYVNKNDGKIMLWPDFLLTVNSVDFNLNSDQLVRIKPLDHASTAAVDFTVMKPILVRDEWLKVKLLDEDFQVISIGWIRWKKGNQLWIDYSLFS
jgi:hypothetical protein